MISVLREISDLRKGKPIIIDYKNSNRYRIVLKELDGTRTGYYFSTPIYNIHTHKAIDLKFKQCGDIIYANGSNANITIAKDVRLENDEGYCILRANKSLTHYSECLLKYNNDILLPATNGIVYKAGCSTGTEFSFELEVGKPFMEIRANDKCFALMSETFRPFVSVSCIGTVNASGEIIAPAMVKHQKISDRKYKLTVTPCSGLGKWIMFEFNLYEPKLIQDTTVESLNPKTNNAFGCTAFIGDTIQFGEQWLYSRLNFANFSELTNKRINKAILHIPKYNFPNIELSAFKVSARFCSFGSNWENKIASSSTIAETQITDKYQNLDITNLFVDKNGYLTHFEGLILKPQVKKSGFSAIATGDSYYSPQIFEINFK